MKSFLYGLAVLPFLAGVALAGEPMQLSDKQMDRVTAGFDISELDVSNTSWVYVSVDQFPNPVTGVSSHDCPNGCYLDISSPRGGLSVAAQFGQARH
jgi:hypothetical protein